jgi:hypothetical protein
VVNMSSIVFWAVTSCGLVGVLPEDGGNTFLRNNGLQNYMKSQFRRTQSARILFTNYQTDIQLRIGAEKNNPTVFPCVVRGD